MKHKIFFYLLFILPVIMLIPHAGDFIFSPLSGYSDIAVSHYPNGVFLQQSVLRWHEIPLWSPAILSGSPFIANPLSGLHYPPGWLAYLFPLPLGFNLLIMLHLVWGGIGMFFFLRSENLSTPASLFGALLFEAMPKLFSHLAAGHLTLLYAVSWTPWVLFAEKQSRPARYRWVLPGILLGIAALADIRWSAYAVLLWLAYSLRNQFGEYTHTKNAKDGLFWGASKITNLTMMLMLASPLVLPLLQYLALSSRSQLSSSDNLTLSLPPAQVAGLLFPNIGGSAEWTLYPGATVFLLVVYSISLPALRRKSFFWIAVSIITIILALGSNIPLVAGVFRLPGLNLLRVPPRVLLITGLAFSMLAAQACETLLSSPLANPNNRRDRSALAMFAVVVFAVLFAGAVAVVSEQALAKINFTWGAAAASGGFLLIQLVRKSRVTPHTFFALFSSLCLVDIIGINGLSLTFQDPAKVLFKDNKVVELLQSNGSFRPFRTYSPSYSLPQQTAAYYGFELADGVDPMQLLDYVIFMRRATGVPSTGYSVTLPPFATGNPAVDNRTYTPDAKLLGLLNVRYILSDFPLKDNRLDLIAQIGATSVYQNPFFLPRAWVQSPDDPIGEAAHPADLEEIAPNHIKIRAAGPGLLVLSEMMYPGWEVSIDRSPGQIVQVDPGFRGVLLDEGEHRVEFSFRPKVVLPGLLLCLAAILVFVGIVIVDRRSRNG